MRKNQVIAVAFVILSGIFVTNYGGVIPFFLFYVSMIVPVVCLIYTIYVCIRFRIYQSTEHKTTVKCQPLKYTYVLSNEDKIPYLNIRAIFHEDCSYVDKKDYGKQYGLIPGEKINVDSTVTCRYCGEYEVGVKIIEIMDFLSLFCFRYHVNNPCKIMVLPRILQVTNKDLLLEEEDAKEPVSAAFGGRVELDSTTRRYHNGDNKKRIHWKATAKRQQLLVRQENKMPVREAIIIMDLRPTIEQGMDSIKIKDKVIETTVALSRYFTSKGMECRVVNEQGSIKQMMLQQQGAFEAFYSKIGSIYFQGTIDVAQLIEATMPFPSGSICIVLAHHVSEALLTRLIDLRRQGIKSVLLCYQRVGHALEEKLSYARSQSLPVIEVDPDTPMEEVL